MNYKDFSGWKNRIFSLEKMHISHVRVMWRSQRKYSRKFSDFSLETFGSLLTSSVVFGNLRLSSDIFRNDRESSESGRKLLDILNKRTLLFGAVFVTFWIKFTVTKNFLLSVLKCLKFNCFMLQSQKIKCLVLSRYPRLRTMRVFHKTNAIML